MIAHDEDVFFIVYKKAGEKDWRPVFKSKATKTEKSKQIWKNIHLDTSLLCDGDLDRDIKW